MDDWLFSSSERTRKDFVVSSFSSWAKRMAWRLSESRKKIPKEKDLL